VDAFYYGTFALLLLQCGFGALISLLSLFQIISLVRRKIPEKVSVLFVFLKLVLAVLNLLAGLYFLSLLRGQMFEPWLVFVFTFLFGLVGTLASRYVRKRQIVDLAN